MRAAGLALVLTISALAAPLHAQGDDGASLTISFANGTTTFHVGEIIPVELSFRALAPDTYDISTRDYDRSGRLDIEQFHVNPPGRDPLQKYYSLGVFMGGGLGSAETLSSQPYVVHEDLNEWVALDKPGHYTLYVTSWRVSRRAATRNEPVELQSNTLEFDIVAADPAWQQQTLSAAVATLNMDSTTKDEKEEALRTLRYLDTPDSARELVHLIGTASGDGDWDEVAGLAGSPYQRLAVDELEKEMSAPNTALTGSYLYILTKLKFQLANKPLPPYPKDDAQAQQAWQKQRKNQDEKYAALQDALYDQAATLVASKFGPAKAETVKALLQQASSSPEDSGLLRSIPPELIASTFVSLSEDGQWDLLTSSWERLKIPTMVAPLEKIAEEPDIKYQGLRDLVFECLYDLDPDIARPIFLKEIQQPHLEDGTPAVKSTTLTRLPDETLPQFDQMLAARLAVKNSPTTDLDAQLTGRYATKAILPKVKEIYQSSVGTWDCEAEDGFVLYFLHTDPDYGVKRLAVAPSACMENSLPAVVKMKRWNEVEPGIIARMNGPDLWRAGQAAEALSRYGDAEAEKALWQRLKQFHVQWAGRADELAVYRPDAKKDVSEAMEFGAALVEAIGKAQGWLLTNDQIRALEDLAFGQERESVKQWQWSSPVELDVNFLGEGLMQATVHQYSEMDMASLLSKIEQYPAGTEFQLNVSGPQDKVAAATARIEDAAATYGVQIEEPTPSDH